MSKGNWASSAKLHAEYRKGETTTMGRVLKDYALPAPESEGTEYSVEELRKCKKCRVVKPLEQFPSQFKKDRNKTYHLHVCKPCRNLGANNKKLEQIKLNAAEDLANAPVVAAVKLFDEHPEALALIIKHFRVDFERIYNAEREAIMSREAGSI